MTIERIPGLKIPQEIGTQRTEANPSEKPDSFAEDLKKAVEGVASSLGSADETAVSAMVGGGSPHEAMLALTKADLQFRMLTQVRNKAVEAYREIMRLTM